MPVNRNVLRNLALSAIVVGVIFGAPDTESGQAFSTLAGFGLFTLIGLGIAGVVRRRKAPLTAPVTGPCLHDHANFKAIDSHERLVCENCSTILNPADYQDDEGTGRRGVHRRPVVGSGL